MADFCRECTPPEYADRNNFVGYAIPGEPKPALCEGCGHHFFDSTGKRICSVDTGEPDPNYPGRNQPYLFNCPECWGWLKALRAVDNP